jgi:hypothetical protein
MPNEHPFHLKFPLWLRTGDQGMRAGFSVLMLISSDTGERTTKKEAKKAKA